MTLELYQWLENHWRKDNHPKYRHLFAEWVGNLTDSQIKYFGKQKFNEENNVLGRK